MRRLFGPICFLFAAGCYNSETFQTDYAASTCGLYDRCGLLSDLDYTDTQDCIDEILSESIDAQAVEESCLNFDRASAKACIDDLETRSCEDDFTQPSSCLAACPKSD